MSPIVNEEFRMFAWRGQGKDILVYPVDYDKQFNVTCTHPEQLSDKEVSDDDSAAAVGETFSINESLITVIDVCYSIQSESLPRNSPRHLS